MGDAERVGLTRSIEELYTFSRLINRTRRRDIGEFTTRKPETVTVEVALAPCTALAEVALSAKSCTTSQKAALCVLPPPVPEMTAVS